MKTLLRVGLGLLCVASMSSRAQADPILFVGEDLQPTANPTVRTNADAAAAAFRTAALAIGQVGTITFESAPLGSFNGLAVAPGVTIGGIDANGSPQTIRNTTFFPSYPSVDGSNTTAGGAKFVEMLGGTLVFTFAQPTQFFGAYLTGVQTNFFADSITFSDGTTRRFALTGTGTSNNVGETAFIGFTDAGKSITSITIDAGSPGTGFDFIGVDDVSYQVSAVPQPSSLILWVIAAAPALWTARRRRRNRA